MGRGGGRGWIRRTRRKIEKERMSGGKGMRGEVGRIEREIGIDEGKGQKGIGGGAERDRQRERRKNMESGRRREGKKEEYVNLLHNPNKFLKSQMERLV